MSEFQELRDTVKCGFDRLHSRLDKAFEEQSQMKVDFSGHVGNPEIHSAPPCRGLLEHVENHKESKSSWLIGVGLIIGAVTYLTNLIMGIFKGQ